MSKTTIAVAILYCAGDEVILVRRANSDQSWDYPGTKVASGESEEQAAARVTQLVTGLDIGPERFGMPIRDVTWEGIRWVSYRANITPDEQDCLASKSPCGTRWLCIVPRGILPSYIPSRRRRAMISAG